MDGFKNSTRTQYDTGGGYAKGGAAKVGKVMGEFGAGKLHSGSKKGPEVTSKKQAVAIALSEARKAGAKIPVKKATGGAMSEMDRRMGEEDITSGFNTKPAMPRKIKNAKDAAPKRDPLIVAKKTVVTVAPKSAVPAAANPIERLLAVKAGLPLKKGGPAAYKKGGKVMRKADGGNVNLAGADGQPVPTTQSASQQAYSDFANQQNAGGPPQGFAQRANDMLGVSVPQNSPTLGARTQAVMPSPMLGNRPMDNRQERMQDRMQNRMERRSEMDERMQGMQDMMNQRRQGRFGPPAIQMPFMRATQNLGGMAPVASANALNPTQLTAAQAAQAAAQRANITANVAATTPSAYKKGGSVKGSKVPVSEKATGETYVSKKAMMKHEASEPRAVKMAEGEIKSKRQVGGMATSVRTNPVQEARDRNFIEARAVPMREMVGKSGYKKGGKTPC